MDAPVIERRATAGITASGRVLSGYAAVFGVDTKIGGFTERIAPGAFKETLASGRDVLALADHDQRAVLGCMKTGTGWPSRWRCPTRKRAVMWPHWRSVATWAA